MKTKLLKAMIAAGYRPYMRNKSDSYLHYTDKDGKMIGYLEVNEYGRYSISSVHNRSTIGTGFRMHTELETVRDVVDMLPAGFDMFPQGIDEYLKDNLWGSHTLPKEVTFA